MSKTKLWNVSHKVNKDKTSKTSITVVVKPGNKDDRTGMVFRTITPSAAARRYIKCNLESRLRKIDYETIFGKNIEVSIEN